MDVAETRLLRDAEATDKAVAIMTRCQTPDEVRAGFLQIAELMSEVPGLATVVRHLRVAGQPGQLNDSEVLQLRHQVLQEFPNHAEFLRQTARKLSSTPTEKTSGPVSAPPEAESPPMSFPERFLGVFISPGPTFRDIARRPDFILPLLVAVPLSVAGTEIFLAKIGIEPVLRWAFEHSSRTANMSPEQMQQLLARLVPFQTIVAHILGVMWMPVLTLLVAVIGLVTLNAIFGVGTNFKTALSVPAYAYLLNVVYYLMSILMVLLGDPEYFVSNPQNPTPTHVGFFLNPLDTSKPLLALGGSLEGFSFWYMVLLGVGFSEVSGRRVKSLPIFLIFLGLWMIVVLIKMGLAALG